MLWVFDLETYFDCFTATFKNYKTKEVKVFVVHGNRDDSEELIKFIDNSNLWLAGYNNHHFDNQILKYMYENRFMYFDESPKDIANHIYKFMLKIIEDDWKDHMWKLPFKSLDLMKIGNLQQKSLKLTGTVFKWHKLQDLPLAHDVEITQADVDTILKYNLNDVEITEKLCQLLEPQIKLRFDISKEYGVNAYSESDSGIANKLLEKFYSEASGLTLAQFKKGRTKRPRIGFWDVIFPDVEFETKQLENFLDKMRQSIFYASHPFNKKSIILDGGKYVTGVGGLHFSREGTMYKSDKNTKIIDIDWNSYYPSMIVNNNIHPQHLGNTFIKKFKELIQDRIDAKKKAKDSDLSQKERNISKIKADTLKICINSQFGKMGYEHHWLYDPLAMLRTTVNGQLYLLMLVEKLNSNKFEIISANTDGITTVVPVNREKEYKKICSNFAEFINIGSEYTYYKLYAQTDVNNYLAVTENGGVKTKGIFNIPNINNLPTDTFMLRRGFDKPIIAIALNEYFINNKPIEETIRHHKDIYDFCTAKKTDKKFVNKFHYVKNSIAHKDQLQQSVRYYISTDGGSLYKEDKETGKMINYCVSKRVSLFNDYYESNDYKIDYNYYIHETQKIIDEIIKPQLTLF